MVQNRFVYAENKRNYKIKLKIIYFPKSLEFPDDNEFLITLLFYYCEEKPISFL